MKTAIFCYSLKGRETARRAADVLKKEYDADMECFCPERIAKDEGSKGFGPIPRPSGDFYGGHFRDKDLLVSVGSVGICVRHIAPYIRSKVTDPAVIVIDELGQHVIPILSGHIGGANRMALALSECLGAEAVITTATDINGRFAVDEWAAKKSMAISSMKAAKDYAAMILERDLPLKSDFPVKGKLPAGTYFGKEGEEAPVGLCITYRTDEPFGETLRLIPACLNLGIGCRRGTPKETIEGSVNSILKESGIDRRAIASISSIDLKKDEEGLLGFSESLGIKPVFYTADELNSLEGEFTPSEFVKSIAGVDNVCERAALMGADEIILKKTALDGVTVSVGLKNTEVCFE